jgi:hypothetical protein
MSFAWKLHDASGVVIRSSEDFSTQEDAEGWMGAEWASLLAEGAESVSLHRDGEDVYTMSLLPA